MTKGIVWCYDNKDIDTAIRRMEARKIHHLPVLNHSKRLVGVLTLFDLAAHAYADLFPHISRLAGRGTVLHAAYTPSFDYDDPCQSDPYA